jgi:hypothetical protein
VSTKRRASAAGDRASLMRNGTDPLLIDLASRECINVECQCGRIVQLAAYQLIGWNGITGTTRAWALRERFRRQKCKRRPPKRMWIEERGVEGLTLA